MSLFYFQFIRMDIFTYCCHHVVEHWIGCMLAHGDAIAWNPRPNNFHSQAIRASPLFNSSHKHTTIDMGEIPRDRVLSLSKYFRQNVSIAYQASCQTNKREKSQLSILLVLHFCVYTWAKVNNVKVTFISIFWINFS